MSQAQQHAYANATNAALIAAPGAGAKIVIVGMLVTGEAAGKITLSFSAGNQKVFDFAAAGSVAVGAMRWEGDANTALGVTIAASGDVSIDYVVEAA
jgi:hypothetical protein